MPPRCRRRSTGDRGWRRTQRTLVATQVAAAFSLLVAAALAGQSMWRLTRVDIGFAPSDTVTFQVSLPYDGYRRYQHGAGFDLGVLHALAALPGVTATTYAMASPSTDDVESPDIQQPLTAAN